MEYEVEVIETLKRKELIDANNLLEALSFLKEQYNNCNIILNENDFIEVDFRESSDEFIKENFNTQDLLQDLLNAVGCDASEEYSKGWNEAIKEAYDIVCKHLNKAKEKECQIHASKVL